MASAESFTRAEYIGEFWTDVRKRLMERHRRRSDEADLGIGKYRRDTECRGLDDVVYNQGVERTAEVVNGVIEKGLPESH